MLCVTMFAKDADTTADFIKAALYAGKVGALDDNGVLLATILTGTFEIARLGTVLNGIADAFFEAVAPVAAERAWKVSNEFCATGSSNDAVVVTDAVLFSMELVSSISISTCEKSVQ